ncbi:hypothetical protein [Streptomyces sp. NPDC002758]
MDRNNDEAHLYHVQYALTSIFPRTDGDAVSGWLPDMSRAVSGLAIA